jgi:hypothetical protein
LSTQLYLAKSTILVAFLYAMFFNILMSPFSCFQVSSSTTSRTVVGVILCSFHNARNRVSHPYKTTAKLYLFEFLFLSFQIADEKKMFYQNGSNHCLNLICF